MVKFMELLTPYEGTTYSDINEGCELTYQERLERGQDEMDMLLDDGEDALRSYIIKNADFEYDDYYRLYGGIIVMTVYKETDDIEWHLRED